METKNPLHSGLGFGESDVTFVLSALIRRVPTVVVVVVAVVVAVVAAAAAAVVVLEVVIAVDCSGSGLERTHAREGESHEARGAPPMARLRTRSFIGQIWCEMSMKFL